MRNLSGTKDRYEWLAALARRMVTLLVCAKAALIEVSRVAAV